MCKSEVKRDVDKNKKTRQQKEQERERMIAPGIRVCRGPDWIWQNQGESKREQGTKDKWRNKFEIMFGSSEQCCLVNWRAGGSQKPVNFRLLFAIHTTADKK